MGGSHQNLGSVHTDLCALTQSLVDNKCLKFGEFTLKSGITSNYYIDLREATLNAVLFHHLVESVKRLVPAARHNGNKSWSDPSLNESKVAIVGVPYGVVPLAAAVAYELKLPYFPVRKETKSYGNKNDSDLMNDYEYIIIEDVMSSGSSIIETIKKLGNKTITDVIVVVDRELGGLKNIKTQYPNVRLQSVLRASMLVAKLEQRPNDFVR